MSSLFAQFATNRKAEVEGVEVTFGGDAVFRIARMSKSNKRYQKMLEQETKPHIHAIRNENLSPEIDEQITMKIFIATILLSWKGVEAPELFTQAEHSVIEGDKLYLPFTPENATKLFKALPELYIALKDNAQKMSLFRAEEIETDSKT
jgi:hypothetical protein